MALESFSVFYYGFTITSSNNLIDFDEGSGELTATLTTGTYPVNSIPTIIKTAMDAVGVNEYDISFDRDTRVFTISSIGNNFDLLISSGSQAGSGPWSLLGFPTAADLTGTDTYSGTSAGGDIYEPQFKLQDYVDPEMFIDRVDPTVNESASGRVESVAFGLRRFIEMSFKFITDKEMDGKVIKNNSTGKADLERFLQTIILKGEFEFMPDVGDRATYYVVILEGLQGNNKGTGYKLRELVNMNLPGIYELNGIKLRVVE